ncbi:MAG: hypothetical protein PF569_07340 [Candidatus Woesearchaeota archaeon]|jgi:hypothetical protein|nr:hypothetical protein [Candidatus Woesearchaeota archaeon]
MIKTMKNNAVIEYAMKLVSGSGKNRRVSKAIRIMNIISLFIESYGFLIL